jgi:hypothetical protein
LLHPPHNVNGKISGFGEQQSFSGLEPDADGVGLFRWSLEAAEIRIADGDAPCTVTLNATMPPAMPPGRDPEWAVSLRRADTSLEDAPVRVEFHEQQPGRFEIVLPAPPGAGPLLLSWTAKPVNLKRMGESADDRNLGLCIHWIGIERGPGR